MDRDAWFWLVLALAGVMGLAMSWLRWKKQREDAQQIANLWMWLNQIAHEIVYSLPPGLVDEAAARSWLLGQIEAFAQRYAHLGLPALFETVDPAVLVDWLLDLLAGLWLPQEELRAQVVGGDGLDVWRRLMKR